WTRLVFDPRFHWNWWGAYVAAALLCAYFHYFSLLLALIVGVAGLFCLPKGRWKAYLGAGLAVLIGFLPHLGLFRDQLAQKGLVEWLGPPEPSFIKDHILYVFNDSRLLSLAMGVFLAVTVYASVRQRAGNFQRFHRLALVFFGVPLAIGYAYSVWVAPVLQHSVLLFSAPFLLLLAVAFVPSAWSRYGPHLALGIALLCTVSTVVEKRFYSTAHFSEFEGLADAAMAWNEAYGQENIERWYNLNNTFYFDLYFDRNGKSLPADFVDFRDPEILKKAASRLAAADQPYLLYAWSSTYNPHELEEMIRQYYPTVVAQHTYFNSCITLYGRAGNYERNPLASFAMDYETADAGWHIKWEQTDSSRAFSLPLSEQLTGDFKYSSTFELPLAEFVPAKGPAYRELLVRASVHAAMPTNGEAVLVINYLRGDQNLAWHGMPLQPAADSTGWAEAFITRPLPKKARGSDRIKVYVWGVSEVPVSVDDLRVELYRSPEWGDTRKPL
ncbi:MAG: hypothetical protein AAGB22_10230, partial [Bacteroidota bacterium]